MPRQKLGQHFLIKGSILERIAVAACPAREPLVIEIGAGKGALTERLLSRADRVIAIELDEYLVGHLQGKFSSDANLTVIFADALDFDFHQWGPAVIAGNLPYYVATPILQRLWSPGSTMKRGVFLIQKEVAERLSADPGSRAYGYLTIEAKLHAAVQILFAVKPAAFRPPPKVDSAVIRIDPRPALDSPANFLKFAGACFRQKRKTIRNNLAAIYGKDTIDTWPEASSRAEQLTVEQLLDMYSRL